MTDTSPFNRRDGPVVPDGRTGERVLRPDCATCAGLCCVAPAFAASADFAIDKPAGRPCPNLLADFRCGIHASLRDRGFPGCVAFDCFGAGQRVTRETYGGLDWRADPDMASRMFAAYSIVRQLHELLWYLREALEMRATRRLHPALQANHDETERLAGGDAGALAALDLTDHRRRVNDLLRSASALARAPSQGPRLDRRGADLLAADLRAVDLRGSDLRGANLIGADLRGVDLSLADITGADVRGSDLRGTDLGGTLFLVQGQVESARGDRATVLPPSLRRPAHWS